MGKKADNKRRKRCFCVGSFNVRGLTEHHSKEELLKDTNRYNVDVFCLQETKIKDTSSYWINGSTIVTFRSDNKHYGNGFVLVKKWKNSIHKYWKVFDRICVHQLQLKTNSEGKDAHYKSEPISDTQIKISKSTTKEKYKEDFNLKIGQRMDEKTASVSGQEEEEMTANPN